jgi:uridine kinase
VFQFLTIIGAGFLVLIFPFMHSEGYRMLVLNAKETGWIYETAWALPLGVKLLFCPAAVLALIFHFLTYEKITKDVLILYSGLLYTLLIILVPPMPGWAAWSIPFIVYFLIRHQITHFYPYWIYNFSYFIYYVVFAPSVAYAIFQPYTVAFPHARDIVFTIMQTSVVLTAAWIYMIGVKSFVQYKLLQKVRVIGIGGDSSSGKHTLAETITHLVGTFNSVRLHGDDYHRWPRGHEAWKSLTHLDPRSNYFREPLEHIQELRKGASITRTSYDHTEGKFLEPTTIHSNRYIIFEGLHPFVFQRLRDVFDIKILLSTNEELRRHWKIERDTRLRGHARQQVLSEINRRSEDAKKFIQPQENFADWVIEYSPIQPKKFDRLKVAHRISSNVVEIEELVERLSQVDSLKVEWHMEPKLTHQRLEIEGHIPATTVRQIATALFPDFYDLMDPSAHWHADLQGINQLIFIAVFKGLQKPS